LAENNGRSRREDKSADGNGKRFVRKKRRSGGMIAKATLLKAFKGSRLANAGAREAAVVFDADLAAAEQVSHCRDSFLGVFGAGTHRKDEVAQRKFTRREELIGFFHRGCALFSSNMSATKWLQSVLLGARCHARRWVASALRRCRYIRVRFSNTETKGR
jgi:hypothetical protein